MYLIPTVKAAYLASKANTRRCILSCFQQLPSKMLLYKGLIEVPSLQTGDEMREDR